MGLKDELATEVAAIFRGRWSTRDGQVVPEDDDVQLGNDAVKLKATVLYADLADSTDLVDGYKSPFAAEVYKTFLLCAAKIIRAESGVITAYDGDRIMAVYVGDWKEHGSSRTAMKIEWVVDEIINPARLAQYPENTYIRQARHRNRHQRSLRCQDRHSRLQRPRLGRPSSELRGETGLVARGAIDVHLGGRLQEHGEDREVREQRKWLRHVDAPTWNTFDDSRIYGSTWRWRVD